MKLVIGNTYKFTYSDVLLEYKGKSGIWHQFADITTGKIWAEVIDEDLQLMEEVQHD